MHCLRPVALLSFVAALTITAPLAAQQPPAATPRLEVGLDAGIAGPGGGTDEARTIIAPRLTVNLSPRTAIGISGDVFASRDYAGESWEDTHIVTAEVRRALVQTGRFAMSGLVGGGVGWNRWYQPEYTYLVRDDLVTVPASLYTSAGAEVTLGVGVEQRVSPRLALRQEVRVVLGETSEFRAQLGVSVPLGRYPTRFDPPLTKSGQRPDSLANGTRIGAIVGAAAMTGFVAFLAHSLCEGDCENLGAALAVGAGYGVGAGALIGAIIDSFRE